MSKITKLKKHPVIFFKDMVAKRRKVQPPKVVRKKAAKPAAKPASAALNLIADTLNPFRRTAHLIHTGEAMTHGPNYLSQWIPYFIASQEPFAVLVRNMSLYKWVREHFPQVQLVYAKNPIEVEQVLSNMVYLRAIYYLNNSGNLIHTLRYNIYQHIYLGHGINNKLESAHKFYRVYDQMWVASQSEIDLFKESGFEVDYMDFVKIGRPQIAHILKNSMIQWNDRMNPNRILYLPAWEGENEKRNFSSLRFSTTMLAEINKAFHIPILTKFDKRIGGRDKLLANISEINQKNLLLLPEVSIANKQDSLDKLLYDTNIIISDIGVDVNELLIFNSPLFIYIPKDEKMDFSNIDFGFKIFAYTFSSIEELIEQLGIVLSGNDYLSKARMDAIDYIYNIDATLNNEFANKLHYITNISDYTPNSLLEVVQ